MNVTTTSQPITATVAGSTVSASVTSSSSTVSAGGGVGPVGAAGPTGSTGAVGPANTLTVGTVTGGSSAAATITGTAPAQVLNLVLPAGATGAQGPQGIQGVAGAAGAKGDKGDTGDVGPQGPAGVAGATGAQGIQGPAGVVGATGATGATGAAGAKGDQGDAGPAGPAGAQGPQGVAGATGAQGPAGSAASATTSASDLTSGTLADARLSANVVLTGDSRLSDARTPATHYHAVADVTGLQTALDAKQAAGSYAAASHTHTAGQVSGLATVATSGSASDLGEGTIPFARIPVGSTSATVTVGNDSRLSNSRTPTTHASTHFAGGSDVITPANIGAVVQADLLNLFGMQATAIDTLPRLFAFSQPALTSGSMAMCFFTPLVTRTISQITMHAGGTTAASGLTLARMGLYTYDDAVTTGTLVAAIANDTTLFTATNTAYTRSLSTGGGLPSTYTLTAGLRYAFGVLCVGTTMPQIVGQANSSGFAMVLLPRGSGQRTSQSDLPTSFTSVSAAGIIPFARLS